jgi:hypothetical protein
LLFVFNFFISPVPISPSTFSYTLSQQIYLAQAVTQTFWNWRDHEKNQSDQPVPNWDSDCKQMVLTYSFMLVLPTIMSLMDLVWWKSITTKVQNPEINTCIKVDIFFHFNLTNSGL